MSDIDKEVDKAIASGESDNSGEPFQAESPCDPAREARAEGEIAMEQVEAFLRNMHDD